MEIADNLSLLLGQIPENVKLVAISKKKPVSDIMEAYKAGQRIFGENKVQELVSKQKDLPADIEWHMVGHLQSNKVKYIAQFVHLIHSVDSLKLLRTIDKEARKNSRQVNCLLQVHIAKEETKFGFSDDELIDLFESGAITDLQYVRIVGLMGMATYTDDNELIREEFKLLKKLFGVLKKNYFENNEAFCEISMGMSGDYKLAIEEGSTMIRIGSLIFGARY
jgi:pyridoxal phosphate enzyme (YggS family)